MERREWMAVLAKATPEEIERAWADLPERPEFTRLRPAETGLVMVRGRAGGTGARFNLGEMTVTRASVRLSHGTVGHAYVAGRNRRHAELAALFDAMLQDDDTGDTIERSAVERLDAAQQERRRVASAKAAATKVDFFTMVRGEG